MYGAPVRPLDALLGGVLFAAVTASCGVAPKPAPSGPAPTSAPQAPAAASVEDPCKDNPEPLKGEYLGVAAKARCDREVYTIMGGVTHALGVDCWYCHIKGDYAAMTDRKRIANWMAQELIPSLRAKTGQDVWCGDCHLVDGKGTAKILGYPRDRSMAIEWMTTHLVEDFETKNGEPLRCKTCHGGNLGTPEFQPKVLLTDRLPK